MSVKRSIKTKARATDDELMKLHSIADEYGFTISEMFRTASLYRDYSEIVFTDTSDLGILRWHVNMIKGLMQTVDILAGVMMLDTVELESKMEKLITVSEKLIEKEQKKREKVVELVQKIAEKEMASPMIDEVDSHQRRSHDICVMVNQEEITEIRKQADWFGVPVSCLLKTNSIRLYGKGKKNVCTDPLTDLNEEMKKVYEQILELTKKIETNPKKKHITEIKKLMNDAIKEISVKTKSISMKAKDLKDEASAIWK